MTRSYRLAAVAALALVCGSFVACSAEVSIGNKIDAKKLEKTLTSKYSDATGSKVTSMDCPSGEKGKKGNTFSCSFETADGYSGKIDVKVTNDDGHFTSELNPADLKVKGDTVAGLISDDFKKTYPDQAGALAGVECDDEVSATPGTKSTCSISSTDGHSTDLTVTMDEQGAPTWDFAEITG